MAILSPTLGAQSYPAANTITSVLTAAGAMGSTAVGATGGYTISSIFIANSSASADTVSIIHAPAGSATTNAMYLLNAYSLAGNTYLVFPGPIYMAATDVLRIFAKNGTCSFNVYGNQLL